MFSVRPVLSVIFFIIFFSAPVNFLFAQDSSWTFHSIPLNNGDIEDFYFLDKDTGWVVGSDYDTTAILSTQNGGQDWIDQSPNISGGLSGVYFVDANIGYAVGEDYNGSIPPIILKTTDGGSAWNRQTAPGNSGGLSDVFFTGATNGIAVGIDTNDKTLILKTGDGTTWTSVNHIQQDGRFKKVFFADENHGWAIGYDANHLLSYVFATNDGGSTWTKQPAPANNSQFEDLFFVNPDTGWVVGQVNPNGLILKTTDGGVNWSSVNAPPSRDISAINFISPVHGFLSVHGNSAASFATVFETEDGGDSWTELSERVSAGHISALIVKQGSIHVFAFFYPMTIGVINIATQLVSIAITPPNPTLQVGESTVFTAQGYDVYGDPVPISDPQWEGDGTNGAIIPDPNDPSKYTYMANSTGSGYVICYEGPPPVATIHGSTDITIVPIGSELDRIDVTPSSVSILIVEHTQFTAKGYDQNGDEITITPNWSTDGGTIDQTGNYQATMEGDYTVTASVTGSTVTGTATVKVIKPDVNDDLVVDGKDLRETLAAILNHSQDLKFDVNGDGRVDGRDLQEILNAIATGAQRAAAGNPSPSQLGNRTDLEGLIGNSFTENNLLSISAVSGTVGSDSNRVAVNLTNDSTVALLQMDVSYDSTVLRPTVVTLAARTSGFAAVFSDTTIDMPALSVIQPGLLRILLFDFNEDRLTQQLVSPGSGAMLEILFDVNGQAPLGDTPLGVVDPLAVTIDADSLPILSQDGVFTVTAGALVRIEVSPDSVSLQPGQIQQFTAAGEDTLGNPVSFQPLWSATGGDIDSSGLYTAASDTGYFQVIARDSLSKIKGVANIHIQIPTAVTTERSKLPTKFALKQNYPNPFNPETTIEFSVAKSCRVKLTVYDIHGSAVSILTDDNYSPGRYEVKFNAADLPSGLYLYKIKMGNFQDVKKMVVLK